MKYIILRTFIGLLIGTLSGALIGAVGFAVADVVFGRSIGLLPSGPLVGALIGIVFVGGPGAIIGAVVGAANLSTRPSVVIGVTLGLLLVLAFASKGEGKYFYETGYFDKQRFFSDMIMYVTWVFGLALVGIMVSATMRGLFARSE